jgi:mono/diheme cytochrome c family protein
MPHFALLADEMRLDIVEYVRYLAIKGEFEQLTLELAYDDETLPDAEELHEIIVERWDSDGLQPQFPGSSETARDQASIERGRALFNEPTKATCFSCHGPTGRGDGLTADGYRDGWGYPIRPRDLSAGVFRAGSEGADLWLTIANGIGGTPMPSYADALTSAEIWDLVHFVQYLALPAAGSSSDD